MTRMTLRWLGQAGFVLSFGETRILIDPWLSEHPLRVHRPESIAGLPDGIGWLLASHEHPDHLDLASLPALVDRYPGLEVVVPSPLGDRVAAVDGRACVRGVQPGDEVRAGDVTVRVVHAWHGVHVSDGYSDGHGLGADGRTPFVGFVVRTPVLDVYHAGDTVAGPGLADEVAALGVDVALLPVNGRDAAREAAGILGNLDAREAVTLAAAVGARLLVPMHHDMVRGNRVGVGRVVDAAGREPRPLSVLVPAYGADIEIGIPR
jgi:L-ascorbate metabolism protein UlaG (beta-lactamase superfamily)